MTETDQNFFKPQTRELDFTMWRYRLLHWVFNADPRDFRQDSDGRVTRTPGGLPTYLYTHYCPLFHFTHILVLSIPFIQAWRLTVIVFWLIGRFVGFVIKKLRAYNEFVCKHFNEWIKDYLPKPKEEVQSPEEIAASERAAVMSYVMNLINEWNYGRDAIFDLIVDVPSFKGFSIDYVNFAREYYDTYIEQCNLEKAKREARQKLMRDRITFFTNVGQVLFKIFQFVFYIGSAVGLAYVLLVHTPDMIDYSIWSVAAAWDFVCWLASAAVSYTMFDILYFLLLLVTYLLVFVTICIILFKLVQLKPIKATIDKTLIAPGKIVQDAIYTFCVWVLESIGVFVEFMFKMYENNCPPIKIVQKDE